tara:strand:+ start:1329 stop:1787 length:459 start_codon:yes stop_codon:yes gene_type:complete
METNPKSPQDYTSQDVHTIFMELYEKSNNEPYDYNNGRNKSPFPFIGNEQKALKKLLSENDVYEILCSMYNAIVQNTTYFSVMNFISSFVRYKTEHDPILYWKVINSDNPKVKKAWQQYIILKSTWFSTAVHNKELKKLEKRFEKWKDEKEN